MRVIHHRTSGSGPPGATRIRSPAFPARPRPGGSTRVGADVPSGGRSSPSPVGRSASRQAAATAMPNTPSTTTESPEPWMHLEHRPDQQREGDADDHLEPDRALADQASCRGRTCPRAAAQTAPLEHLAHGPSSSTIRTAQQAPPSSPQRRARGRRFMFSNFSRPMVLPGRHREALPLAKSATAATGRGHPRAESGHGPHPPGRRHRCEQRHRRGHRPGPGARGVPRGVRGPPQGPDRGAGRRDRRAAR